MGKMAKKSLKITPKKQNSIFIFPEKDQGGGDLKPYFFTQMFAHSCLRRKIYLKLFSVWGGPHPDYYFVPPDRDISSENVLTLQTAQVCRSKVNEDAHSRIMFLLQREKLKRRFGGMEKKPSNSIGSSWNKSNSRPTSLPTQ